MSDVLDDINLDQALQRMVSGGIARTIVDSEGVSFDIPFSDSYDQWSSWIFKIGGVEKMKLSALGDGGGGIAQSSLDINGPTIFHAAVTTDQNIICHGGVKVDNTFSTEGNLFYVDETGYMLVGYIEIANGISLQRNIVFDQPAGSGAEKVIALSNSALAPLNSTDIAQLFAKDINIGRATLALVTEETINTDVGLASTHSGIIFWNGNKYKIPLTLVP